MSRIEDSKIVPYANLAAPDGALVAPKIVMYAWIEPGGGGEGDSTAQGYAYGQVVEA